MGADYGTGFSVGKAKAHFEVRHWSPGEHSSDCGCEVCKTVQTVLLKVFGPEEMDVVSAEMASRGMDDIPCRVCGCTDDDCYDCFERTGEPCHWVERDLCSACVGVKEEVA